VAGAELGGAGLGLRLADAEHGVDPFVALHHDEEVRVHVGEQPADRVALAASALGDDERARRAGRLGRSVGGIVVADDDSSARQMRGEVLDHAGDRGRLVVTGHENGHVREVEHVLIPIRSVRRRDSSRLVTEAGVPPTGARSGDAGPRA
jgi:hypothetical protein